MLKLSIAFLLAMTLPAAAFSAAERWDPPARYQKPYQGELTVIKLPPREVAARCRVISPSRNAAAQMLDMFRNYRGCAEYSADRKRCTIIVIDRPAYGTNTQAVIDHEMGHCNGWPYSHPKQ